MKIKNIAGVALAAILGAGALGWQSLDKETRGFLAAFPTNTDILFWRTSQRDAAFRALDRLSFLAQHRVVPAGGTPSVLPPGPPLALPWTSFSVAKSLTSTLVGMAVRDGHIKSMDDKVSDYIAEMKGSAYDDVSIRQLLTMTSGVAWNENYDDPKSDVAQFNNHKPKDGEDAVVSYLRKLPRAVPAGTRWLYSTGETNLVGVLVARATKKTLSDYLSEKIWRPVGMAQQATWILSKTGQEISGCCLQAATQDFARFGQFILSGAQINGQPTLPEGWLSEATTSRTGIGQPGRGYGYQWWTYEDGSFAARGIFGQGIFIDPARQLVIASNANWGHNATDPTATAAREAFYVAVQQAVDAEVTSAAVKR
jgi:CubicO group peptidase (beta-lactamase class C family)